MLLGDFYKISDVVNEELSIQCTIALDKQHKIFQGHFPNQPLLPAACMINMVKEIWNHHSSSPILFLNLKDVKFLKMVDPNLDNTLKLDISAKNLAENNLQLKVNIIFQDAICCKLLGNALTERV